MNLITSSPGTALLRLNCEWLSSALKSFKVSKFNGIWRGSGLPWEVEGWLKCPVISSSEIPQISFVSMDSRIFPIIFISSNVRNVLKCFCIATPTTFNWFPIQQRIGLPELPELSDKFNTTKEGRLSAYVSVIPETWPFTKRAVSPVWLMGYPKENTCMPGTNSWFDKCNGVTCFCLMSSPGQ